MSTICWLTECNFKNEINKYSTTEGSWVAQPVKRTTLDFSAGRDLKGMRLSPVLGSTQGVQPA